MQVDEGADAEQEQRERPATTDHGQQGHQRHGREDVALVHARGQDEEGDSQEGHGHDERPAVVPDGTAGDTPEEAQHQQRGSDGHPRDGPDEPDGVVAPGQAFCQRRLSARTDEGPQVVGVDAEPGIPASRAQHALDVFERAHAEGQGDDEEGRPGRQERRQQANRALLVPEPVREAGGRPRPMAGPGADAKQVPLDEHGGHDGDEHHAELWLDQCRGGGQGGRPLAVATDERSQAQQHDQGSGGVGLAPQRGVVERDGVEDVQRRRGQTQPLVARARPGPAPDQAVEDVAHREVEQDRWQLDEVHAAGDIASECADQPQGIEVGGRVVGEAGVLVEAGRPVLGHGLGPRGIRG